MTEETKQKLIELQSQINLGGCNTKQLASWLFDLIEILIQEEPTTPKTSEGE